MADKKNNLKMAIRCHKDIKTSRKGISAHITWTAKPSNINIRGYLIDSVTGVQLDGLPAIRKTAVVEEDIEYVTNQIVADLSERYEFLQNSKRAKNIGLEGAEEKTFVELSFSELLKSKVMISYEWKATTQNQYLTFFERNVLPEIKDCIYPEDFTAQDRENLKDKLRRPKKKMKGSSDEEGGNDAEAGRRLYQAQKIYDRMRELNPDLPRLFIDDGELSGRIKQNEQYKTLPVSVHAKLRKIVENEVETNPKIARGAALMDSGALRSGEASAVTVARFIDYGWYATVWVLYQEEEGMISDSTKSDDGYRLVVLDGWGTRIVRKCNELIGAEIDIKVAPVVDKTLSAWVRDALERSGCSREYMDSCENYLEGHLAKTGKDEKFKDVAAHILRRNRASIWRNICGFIQWELDYLLGHRNYDSRFDKEEVKNEKNITRWATMMERFDTETRNGIEPGVFQIEIAEKNAGEIMEFSEYSILNNSDTPITLSIDIEAAEMGEEISIISKSNNKPKAEVGFHDTKGTRKNRYIIGILKKESGNDKEEKQSGRGYEENGSEDSNG